jgi:protein O-GlcNAc transferase
MNRAEKRRQKKIDKKAPHKAVNLPHENLSHLFAKAVQNQKSGQLEIAKTLYQKILSINPKIAEVHCNLGSIQNILGDNANAERSYHHAITLKPDYADAHGNLGNALSAMGRLEEAITCYKEALILEPENANLHNSLGGGLQELGLHSDAIASFATALSLAPKFAEAHSNLGISLKETNRFDEALQSYECALSIRPDFAEALGNKGNALKDLGRLDEAVTCYKQALAIRCTYTEAQCNLGSVLMSMGQLDEALICFERTLADRPNHRLAANNYLHTLLYKPSISNDDLFNACRKIANERKPANILIPFPMVNLKRKNRIRIGYISSDFREHPVGHNIMPILANHDHQKYEIFCYAELTAPDSMTNKFQEHADHWQMIKGLTDNEVAERIQADRIHIAVFLGGHFDENRPDIAAYKAAPIQVSMYGGTTTAFDTMDYWLTDEILHPRDTTERFTEKLWHLPSLFTFSIPKDTPPENELPAIKNGYVTFVSFNKPCKVNDDVIDLWAEILDAIPNSKLHLKFINFLSNQSIAKRILTRFKLKGISSKRIHLISKKENAYDHLLRYNQADIALDTFPFSGATTTFQAMWMGVPVITLMGDRFIARMGATLTSQIGLGSIIANTKDEYLSHAVAMAEDIKSLQETRKTLRQKIYNSSLCNGLVYTQNLETAYHGMVTA